MQFLYKFVAIFRAKLKYAVSLITVLLITGSPVLGLLLPPTIAEATDATWQIETVDSIGDVGKYTSLAFDANGKPAISYYNDDSDDLKYAHWNGSSWDIETVDAGGSVGERSSLTFDDSGNPAISYRDLTNTNLKYAHWNGSSWDVETVDSSGDVGAYTSLVFDGSGNPAIGYYDSGNLNYANWNGSSWDIETVDDTLGIVGENPSLAFDLSGNPAISHVDSSNSDLKLCRWNGSSWVVEVVDSSGNVGGGGTSLAFDPLGNPAISYDHDVSAYTSLWFAHWNGTSWDIETVDGQGGLMSSLLYDYSGNPMISYLCGNTYQELRYASWNGLSWDIEVVDDSPETGWWTSLALDDLGNPAISYYDYDSGNTKNLKYAYLPSNHSPDASSTPQCENRTNPIGVTNVTPEFSWTFTDPDPGNTQSAYRILVASSSANLTADNGDMWDSRKVSSSTSTDISYSGSSLSWGTTYYWKIKTWDNHNAEGLYSTEQTFNMSDKVFTYSGTGVATSLPFDISSSPWKVQYTINQSGYFRFVVAGNGSQTITADSKTGGQVYEDHIYGFTGSNVYFDVTNTPAPDTEWTITVFETDTTAPGVPSLSSPIELAILADRTPAFDWSDIADDSDVTYHLVINDSDALTLDKVFTYSGTGVKTSLPFDISSSPWKVQYTINQSGYFRFVVAGNGSQTITADSKTGGQVYEDYIYGFTGSNVYFDVTNTPAPDTEWTITVFENPAMSSPDFTRDSISTFNYTLNDTEPLPNGTYYWRVRAIDGNNNFGAWSSFRSFTISANAPNQPSNSSPTDEAPEIAVTAMLQSSAFSDLDVGDTHSASQWQITSTSGDYASPVYDSGTDITNKTAVIIPADILSENAIYYWRARHQDNQGDWSPWSIETTFTTIDTTDPAVTIDDVPDYLYLLGDISGTASDTLPGELDKVQVQIINNTNSTYWDGGAWQALNNSIETVDSTGTVGKYTSLAFDNNGNPAISYFDATAAVLKYALWSGSGWDILTADSSIGSGLYTSLAFDNNGNPAIGYATGANDHLKFARWNGSTWDVETVDNSVVVVGHYPSLVFDGSDNPAISYYDGTNYDLKFTRWNGSSWDIETVDSEGQVGYYTSLAFDGSGSPGISYYDKTNTALKFAMWNGSSWDIETVDSEGVVGRYTSLAYDSSDNPAISYQDVSNLDLKFAWWNGSSWDTQTVTSEIPDYSLYNSLAFDIFSNPAISYYEYNNRDLKYAYYTDGSWDLETINPSGLVGDYNSLAFDMDNNPAISYYDTNNGDLKFARLSQGATWFDATGTALWSHNFGSISLSNGDVYTIKARALDGAASYSTTAFASFTHDNQNPTAPSSPVRTTPNSDSTPTITWDAATDVLSGIASYEVKLDDGIWSDIGNVVTYTFASPIADGIPTVYIRAKDNAGLVSSSVSFSSIINTAPNPALSESGGIAFTNGNDIYVMNSDGSNQTRLTIDPASDTDPVWSPNGAKIAFRSDRDGDSEIFVMDADGSNIAQLTHNDDDDHPPITWAPDGSKVYFPTTEYGGGYEICVINVDGTGQTNLTNSPGSDYLPEISPDGSNILFYSTRNGEEAIYVMDSDGSNVIKVADCDWDTSDWGPSWSSNGTKVIFPSYDAGDIEIFVVDADGSNPTRLTDNTANDRSPLFSPDDTKVLFISDIDGDRELYVMNADGSNKTQLTDSAINWGDYARPRWSPDSTMIAFVSSESGYQEIYTVNVDGSSKTKLTGGDTSGARRLSWSYINPLTVTFDGWYVSDILTTTATQNQEVVAKILLAEGFLGLYTMRIRRDIDLSADETVEELDFSYDGYSTMKELVFTPPHRTDDVNTNGYHINLLYGDDIVWTMTDNYPPRLTVINEVPNKPYISFLDPNLTVSLSEIVFEASIASSTFSDPDSGDTHAASQWQITTTSGDYSSPIYDSGADTVNKTSLTTPNIVLTAITASYYRVRYEDSRGDWSDWSNEIEYTPRSNTAPDRPANSSPADEATDVSLTPTLDSSAFSDFHSYDIHAASQWQITTVSGNYSSPVYDSGTDTTNKTSLTILADTLSYSTIYYWRVRYTDNYGSWSDWSSETSFETEILVEQVITAGGGTVETPNEDVVITIPSGAIGEEIMIVLRVTHIEDTPTSLPPGSTLCETFFTITGVENLEEEATITVNYSAADVATAGGNPKRLALARWDEDAEVWIVLPTILDTVDQTLTVTTDHFSTWITIVRAPTTWENMRWWFLPFISVIFGILLLLFMKSMTLRLILATKIKQWRKEGYDIPNQMKRQGYTKLREKIYRLRVLEQSVTSMSAYTDAFPAECESIARKLKTVSKLDEIEKQWDALKHSIPEYTRKMNQLKNVEKALAVIESKTDIFNTEIDSIRSKLQSPDMVEEVEKQLEALKNKIPEYTNKMYRLKTAEKTLAAIRLPADIFNIEVNSIRSKLQSPDMVEEVEKQLKALRNKINEYTSKMNRLKNVEKALAAIEPSTDIFDTEINSIRSKLKSPDIVEEVEAELISLRKKIDDDYKYTAEIKEMETSARKLYDNTMQAVEDAKSMGLEAGNAEELMEQSRDSLELKEYKAAEKQAKQALQIIAKISKEAKPEIKVKLKDNDFQPGEWKRVKLVLTNDGKAHAKEIELQLSAEVSVKDLKGIPKLDINANEIIDIMLKPKDIGEVPLDIEISYQDYQDKKYTVTQRFSLNVKRPDETETQKAKEEALAARSPLPSSSEQLPKKYEILEPIGSGGFAEVYRAIRKKDKQIAAIKMPKMAQFATVQPTDFMDEAKIWKKLDHKNIITVYEHGIKPYPWIAMEYMDGGSLRGKIGKLSIKESLGILLQVCDALYYSHHRGVVHRDIKPDNVLFDKDGTAKVGDWGLGRMMLEFLSQTGASGTPIYSAPEQIDPKKYGETGWWTDIYQLAVMAYEMFTGKVPFYDDRFYMIPMIILTQELVKPSEINPEIPAELDEVIMKACDKNKDNRYEDISGMRKDLERVKKTLD